MSIILAQFVSELLLTMCKVYQNFYDQSIYTNIIIGLICSINLLKSSLFLKFNTFIHTLTTSHFHSFHPTLMHYHIVFLVLWICCCVIYQLGCIFRSENQLKEI